jgi:NAD(P)-dependent dehydrogenase (short-subunit alcohol dehydrogenase family)
MSADLEDQATWEAGIPAFLYRQLILTPPAPPASTDLTGRTAIITGSNSGLGFECAKQLFKLRLSRLIMAVRSPSKGAAAAAKLKAEFPEAEVDVWPLDMESYESIVFFAKRCREELSRIDYAILNAGVLQDKFIRCERIGHEMTVQVNYLSTTLLATLLIPVLKDRRPLPGAAKLTICGSDTAYWSTFDGSGADSLIGAFDAAGDFGMKTYQDSNFLLMLLVPKLAERVVPAEVTVNLTNSGFTHGTNLHNSLAGKIAATLVGWRIELGVRPYLDAVLVKARKAMGASPRMAKSSRECLCC